MSGKHFYIREWRQARGLSQVELGERLGVDHRTIGRWENHQSMPSLDRQRKLAEALGIKPLQLLAHPDSVSVDAMIEGLSPDQRRRIVDMVRLMLDD